MKSLRILLACTLGLLTSTALLRADEHAEKKHEAADAHASEKKPETHPEKDHAGEKPEKKEEHKS